MSLIKCIDTAKSIQTKLQNFFDNENINDLQQLILFLNNYHIQDNIYNFSDFLKILMSLVDNHHRGPDFYEKVEIIIKSFKEDIKKYYSNENIFSIFSSNKKILLFLIEEKILIYDDYIHNRIINGKYFKLRKYPKYFNPEIHKFNDTFGYDMKNIEEFETKRRIGENDSKICKLIRNDSIDEFIFYVNQVNFPLSTQIEKSVFETNLFLMDKTPTLIEYSAFFGSIQIFKYLQINGIELTPSLWLYAIHSNNAEIINNLEDNHIIPQNDLEVHEEAYSVSDIDEYLYDPDTEFYFYLSDRLSSDSNFESNFFVKKQSDYEFDFDYHSNNDDFENDSFQNGTNNHLNSDDFENDSFQNGTNNHSNSDDFENDSFQNGTNNHSNSDGFENDSFQNGTNNHSYNDDFENCSFQNDTENYSNHYEYEKDSFQNEADNYSNNYEYKKESNKKNESDASFFSNSDDDVKKFNHSDSYYCFYEEEEEEEEEEEIKQEEEEIKQDDIRKRQERDVKKHEIEEEKYEIEDEDFIHDSYIKCLNESIKCHHNEIANYIINNYLKNDEKSAIFFHKLGLKYHNYFFIDPKLIDSSFYELYQFDYFSIFQILIKNGSVDGNSILSFQKDYKIFGYTYHQKREISPLFIATKCNDSNLVNCLLKEKCNINYMNKCTKYMKNVLTNNFKDQEIYYYIFSYIFQ